MTAPAVYLGLQPFPGRDPIELYNLTAPVGSHPAGSTVSRQTLEEAGFTFSQQGALEAGQSHTLSHRGSIPRPATTSAAIC